MRDIYVYVHVCTYACVTCIFNDLQALLKAVSEAQETSRMATADFNAKLDTLPRTMGINDVKQDIAALKSMMLTPKSFPQVNIALLDKS